MAGARKSGGLGHLGVQGRRPRRRALYLALAVSIAVVVVVALGWVGCVRAWRWLAGLEEFQVRPGELCLDEIEWLDVAAFMEDVRATDPSNILTGKCSFFTPGLASKVAEAYGRSPWVRRVNYVRRRFPSTLEISLSLRRPYAQVLWEGDRAMVSRRGVVLSPSIYRVPAQGLHRPAIRLQRVPERVPRPGQVWGNGDVVCGLTTLQYLEEKLLLARLPVKCIEVRLEGGLFRGLRRCVVLHTAAGAEIRWGLPPHAEGLGAREVESETKLHSVLSILKYRPELLSAKAYIDVRHDVLTWPEGGS